MSRFKLIASDTNSMIPFLSRRGVHDPLKVVQEAISTEFYEEIRLQYGNQFEQANPLERLILLGRLASYVVPPDGLEQIFSIDQWPIPFLDQTGQKSFHLLQDLSSTIEIIPKYFMRERKQLSQAYFQINWFESALPNANELMPSSLQKLYITDFGFDSNDGSPTEWLSMNSCISHVLNKRFKLSGIRVGHIESSNLPYVIEQHGRVELQSCTQEGYQLKAGHFPRDRIQEPGVRIQSPTDS